MSKNKDDGSKMDKEQNSFTKTLFRINNTNKAKKGLLSFNSFLK